MMSNLYAKKRACTYHEISLCELEFVGEFFLGCIACGSLNLIVVVVQSHDIGSSELDNLSRRSSHTASYVQYTHVLAETHHVGKVVFVTGNGLVKRLAIGVATEVETLAPAILV